MAKIPKQQKEISDCILFSTADWDTPYWTNKQHTARLLSERGWQVLYVESVGLRSPNFTSGTDWGRLWRRLWRGLLTTLIAPRRAEQNLWILSPLVIPLKHHWPIIRALNQGILRWSISRFVKSHNFRKPLIWTYQPFILEILSGFPTDSLVYHCVDDLAAIPGIDGARFLREEEKLIKRSSAVFTTTKALQDKCSVLNSNSHYFSNVVDMRHFGRALEPGILPKELFNIPEPRLVYHGVLSDFKIDFDLILSVVKMRPEWQWIFIGDEREGQASETLSELKKFPNVHFLGYRSYEIMPEYLRAMNVGLLPSLLNEYTRSMFPMKYFEYLAAGLPVVSTGLDFTAYTKNGLMVSDSPKGFCKAIEKQLKRGKLTKKESLKFVGENTWDARMDKMLKLIGG